MTPSLMTLWYIVARGMRGDLARKACPELQLVQVPTAHGKADLTLYRDAGKQVSRKRLAYMNPLVELSFLDLAQNR